jgi:hypothetical protein
MLHPFAFAVKIFSLSPRRCDETVYSRSRISSIATLFPFSTFTTL